MQKYFFRDTDLNIGFRKKKVQTPLAPLQKPYGILAFPGNYQNVNKGRLHYCTLLGSGDKKGEKANLKAVTGVGMPVHPPLPSLCHPKYYPE